MKNENPIAILGAGSFGTALALHLSRLGQDVHLWTYDKNSSDTLSNERENKKYLPGYFFPVSLQVFSDLKKTVENTRDILVVVPSHAFSEILIKLKPFLTDKNRIVCATKGLDTSGELLHVIARKILGEKYPYAMMSGPTYAKEIAAELPTAIVIASPDKIFSDDLIQRFASPRFRPYFCEDMIGVEIGGIVKNTLAIAIGISDGMGFGANTRAALITRGLAEMIRLGIAMDASIETFMGLSGVGDLVLTATDNQSRNRRFGLALGMGKSSKTALKEIGQVVEGKSNAALVVNLAKKHHIEMPITECVFAILQGKITPKEAMEQLLSREPKKEC